MEPTVARIGDINYKGSLKKLKELPFAFLKKYIDYGDNSEGIKIVIPNEEGFVKDGDKYVKSLNKQKHTKDEDRLLSFIIEVWTISIIKGELNPSSAERQHIISDTFLNQWSLSGIKNGETNGNLICSYNHKTEMIKLESYNNRFRLNKGNAFYSPAVEATFGLFESAYKHIVEKINSQSSLSQNLNLFLYDKIMVVLFISTLSTRMRLTHKASGMNEIISSVFIDSMNLIIKNWVFINSDNKDILPFIDNPLLHVKYNNEGSDYDFYYFPLTPNVLVIFYDLVPLIGQKIDYDFNGKTMMAYLNEVPIHHIIPHQPEVTINVTVAIIKEYLLICLASNYWSENGNNINWSPISGPMILFKNRLFNETISLFSEIGKKRIRINMYNMDIFAIPYVKTNQWKSIYDDVNTEESLKYVYIPSPNTDRDSLLKLTLK